MLTFSGWNLIGTVAVMGQVQGSAIIGNLFFGTIFNAAFGIANQLNSLINMFARNLGQAAIPQIIKSHGRGDDKRMTDIVVSISKYSFFLMLIPALPILLETEYLLELWLGDIPEYTVIFTKLLILQGLISSLQSGVPSVVQATGKVKWFNLINGSALLIGLPVSYLLFKLGFQPFYIHIVYIVIIIFNTMIPLYLLSIFINFDVKYLLNKSYLKIVLVASSLLPLFCISNLFQASLLRFLIFSGISVLSSITSIYLLGLEKAERAFLVNGIILLKNKMIKH